MSTGYCRRMRWGPRCSRSSGVGLSAMAAPGSPGATTEPCGPRRRVSRRCARDRRTRRRAVRRLRRTSSQPVLEPPSSVACDPRCARDGTFTVPSPRPHPIARQSPPAIPTCVGRRLPPKRESPPEGRWPRSRRQRRGLLLRRRSSRRSPGRPRRLRCVRARHSRPRVGSLF